MAFRQRLSVQATNPHPTTAVSPLTIISAQYHAIVLSLFFLNLQHVTLPLVAPSLGGVETLATRPVLTTHVGLTPQERQDIGVHDGLIRCVFGVVYGVV